MLTPPAGLSQSDLSDALASWGLEAADLDYVPVGFGTHHWTAVDPSTGRWFVNVDELAGRRLRADEPLDAPLTRLRSALSVPRALGDLGFGFTVAPEPGRDGSVVRVLGKEDEYALSVYRYLSGQSFTWAAEGWTSAQVVPEHAAAIPTMLAELHAASAVARAEASVDDFAIPVRDVLDAVLAGTAGRDHGPFTDRTVGLLADHAARLRPLYERYDELAALGRAQQDRFVLTHGEPHPGNTMRVADRFVLIDWDTVLIAPPERDLWTLTPEMTARYTRQSGISPDPAMLELYRLRWDLAEVALYTAQFHVPHGGSANDAASWENLVRTVGGLTATRR